MMRIWNINTSRIDTCLGIRKIAIHNLKNKSLIFYGEIKKSSGSWMKINKNYESIIFTNNIDHLKKLSENDWLYKYKQKLLED